MIYRKGASKTRLKNNPLVDDEIVFQLMTKRSWTLKQLLADITKHNLHTEIEIGTAVGREIW